MKRFNDIDFSKVGVKAPASDVLDFEDLYAKYRQALEDERDRIREESQGERTNIIRDTQKERVPGFVKLPFTQTVVYKAYCELNDISPKKSNKELPSTMMAAYAKHDLYFRDDGSVDLAKTYANLTYKQRGELLLATVAPSELTADVLTKTEIGPLVPLYFAAHKQYNNVPYSKFLVWDNYLSAFDFLPRKLLQLFQFSQIQEGGEFLEDYPLDAEKVNFLRDTWYTASKINYITNNKIPTVHLKAAGIDTDVVPDLAINLMLQTWAAYPASWVDNFNQRYAMLNPNDWDTPPAPIWGSATQPKKLPSKVIKKIIEHRDTPW